MKKQVTNQIRVLLVDDQTLFVESLKIVIDTRAPDLAVVGVAHDGMEAVNLAGELKPDIVLMDVRMPGMDGVEAAKMLHEHDPSVCVLMLTTFDDDQYVYEALHHGASGYLLKDMDPAHLIEAIRGARTAGVLMSPSIAARMVDKAYGNVDSNTAGSGNDDTVLPRLSRRDREVLELLVKGLDNTEIAQQLNVAMQTVKNRVSELYFKFDVPDRLHLIRLAKSLGWDG